MIVGTRNDASEWMHQTAEELLILSKTYNISPTTLAVAWVSKNPNITAPIISAKTIDQLQPSLDVLNYKMPDELYTEITRLSLSPAPATDRLEETYIA
jgi:aryl-alcohol dehydrogenase-like predicted oxidoreductase